MSDLSTEANQEDLRIKYARRRTMPQGQTTKYRQSDKPGQFEVVKEGGDIDDSARLAMAQEKEKSRISDAAAKGRAADVGLPKQAPGESFPDYMVRVRKYREERAASAGKAAQMEVLKKK